MMFAAPSAVKVHKNAKIMFHGSMGGVMGGSQAMRDEANLLEKINADIKTALLTKTSLSPEVVDEWFAEGREGWLTAQEAVDVGLASEIIDLEVALPESSKTISNAMQERGMQIAALLLEPKAEDEPENEDEPEAPAEDEKPEPVPEGEAPGDDEPEPEDKSQDDTPEDDDKGAPTDGPTDEVAPVADPADETPSDLDVVALSEKLEEVTVEARDWQAKHDKLQEQLKTDAEAHVSEVAELNKKVEEAEEANVTMSSRVRKLSLQAAAPAEGDGEAVSTWPAAVKACGGDLVKAKKMYPEAHKAYFDKAQTISKP